MKGQGPSIKYTTNHALHNSLFIIQAKASSSGNIQWSHLKKKKEKKKKIRMIRMIMISTNLFKLDASVLTGLPTCHV